jgi:acyl-CoA reductase-like NAD-dependent aldehyde dehydrogenase
MIAKPQWMNTPAPVRGEVVRRIGDKLRANKQELGESQQASSLL